MKGKCSHRTCRLHVLCRKHNHSAFNGYRLTPSEYSLVQCLDHLTLWRTKAAYVAMLQGYCEPAIMLPERNENE